MPRTHNLKYYVVSFCPKTFEFTRTEKIYTYKTITVAEYRKKWNLI
jgi:hypothetical protein